jgi:hypothetical protein
MLLDLIQIRPSMTNVGIYRVRLLIRINLRR